MKSWYEATHSILFFPKTKFEAMESNRLEGKMGKYALRGHAWSACTCGARGRRGWAGTSGRFSPPPPTYAAPPLHSASGISGSVASAPACPSLLRHGPLLRWWSTGSGGGRSAATRRLRSSRTHSTMRGTSGATCAPAAFLQFRESSSRNTSVGPNPRHHPWEEPRIFLFF